jgi:hypothetical protein
VKGLSITYNKGKAIVSVTDRLRRGSNCGLGAQMGQSTPKGRLLKVPVEVATDRERSEHDCNCNRGLHGVVEHGLAHHMSPFMRHMSKLKAQSALTWIK